MLIVSDKRLLNDGRLDGKEALIKYQEEKIEPMHDTYRLYDHDLITNIKKRAGQKMHHSQLIQKVTELNPTIWADQQINYPNDLGFYSEVFGKKTYLSMFTKGWIPEFSYVLVDERNLPEQEVRGWRACLVRLLAWGAIDWNQVSETFGDSEGINSERWKRMTRDFRAEACCMKVQKNWRNRVN